MGNLKGMEDKSSRYELRWLDAFLTFVARSFGSAFCWIVTIGMRELEVIVVMIGMIHAKQLPNSWDGMQNHNVSHSQTFVDARDGRRWKVRLGGVVRRAYDPFCNVKCFSLTSGSGFAEISLVHDGLHATACNCMQWSWW